MHSVGHNKHMIMFYYLYSFSHSRCEVLFTTVLTVLCFVCHTFIHSVVCLMTGYSFVQSQFSKGCSLVLPLSIYTTLSFPCGHLLAAYFFFPVFPSLVSLRLSFPPTTRFRWQFLSKMWPIQLAVLLLIVCRIFLFHLTM